MRFTGRMIGAALGLSMAFVASTGSAVAADKLGSYERILSASGDFAATTAAFEAALAGSGLTVHGKMDWKVPNGIQKARTYVLTSPAYMQAAAGQPANTISAQVMRVGIYEFAAGKKTFVNMTNPTAHAILYYKNDAGMVTAAKAMAQEIRNVVAKVPGTPEQTQIEPVRDADKYNGFNGDGPAKMMAKFRNFSESQLVIFEGASSDFNAIVARVEATIKGNTEKGADDVSGWRLVAKVPVRGDAVYFGITNDYTETKCTKIDSDFRSDGKTKDAPFPAVDHAPALPLEVLVINDGKKTKVVQYGEMWRMQLYYWDAGYLAFGKNTLIPEKIVSSIEDAVKLAQK